MTCYLFRIRKACSYHDCNLHFPQAVRVTPAPFSGQESAGPDEAVCCPKFCCILYKHTWRPHAEGWKHLGVSKLGALSHQRWHVLGCLLTDWFTGQRTLQTVEQDSVSQHQIGEGVCFAWQSNPFQGKLASGSKSLSSTHSHTHLWHQALKVSCLWSWLEQKATRLRQIWFIKPLKLHVFLA